MMAEAQAETALPLSEKDQKLLPMQSDYLVQIEQWVMWSLSLEQGYTEIMFHHRFFNWISGEWF